MSERKRKRPTKARRRRSQVGVLSGILALIVAIPAAYLAAALLGSLIPVNSDWTEPADGITIYLADNGIHTDIILPVEAAGVDWRSLLSAGDAAAAPANARWVAFGSGEEQVYLETPRWQDIRSGTIWAALTGGRRVIHVEWVGDPSYAERQVRLRPDEYRRLWAAIRADFQADPAGRPVRIAHPGYDCCDSFYRGAGHFNALRTCNVWVSDKLRIAGVKASLWPPFTSGLLWRYRMVTARSG